jgi:translation elongation factor EF-Ts
LSLNNLIWCTKLEIQASLAIDLAGAAQRVFASRSWVYELECASDQVARNEGFADTLAAWWEQAAAVAQAQGNAADVAAALAKAHHWRDRQRELRASQADSGE